MSPETIVLRDSASGASAEVAVHLGFNCFRFTAQHAGRPVEVLYSHPAFSSGTERPSGSGIPILFPFPGRIPGTEFRWQGKTYPLEPGDALGNAIHGFVLRRPWRVVEQSDTRVVGQFHAWRDDPNLKNRWPADFRITADYSLSGNTLATKYTLENPGDVPLPWGLGTHPYFRVPLGGPRADDCLVRLPVSARWELANMLPTGRRLELPDRAAFQAGRRFGDLVLDDVFSGLSFEGGMCQAQVHDPAAGCRTTIRFDSAFRECVVYTPPHRAAICIEPYTCVAGAFGLLDQPIDTGAGVLPPGGRFTAQVEIALE
jgi:aldose 1-epimerase